MPVTGEFGAWGQKVLQMPLLLFEKNSQSYQLLWEEEEFADLLKHLFYCSCQTVIKIALESHWKGISKSSDISSLGSVLYYSIKIW